MSKEERIEERRRINEILNNNSNILYSILGHLYGDGGVYSPLSRIIYCNNNLVFIKSFKEEIESLFKIEGKIKKQGGRGYIAEFHHSILVRELIDRYGKFSTKKAKPKIRFLNRQNKIAFLKALFDDEGSITKQWGSINIVNSNFYLIKLIKELLIELGVTYINIYKPYNKKYKSYFYIIRLSKLENRRFYDTIGFSCSIKNKILEDNLNYKYKTHNYPIVITKV